MSALAALKKFGLVVVDEENERLEPSQLAIEIINRQAEDPRRACALAEAALKPPVYRQLVDRHKDSSLPADDILEGELVINKRFNPDAVGPFLRNFKDSLVFAGLIVNDKLKLLKLSRRPYPHSLVSRQTSLEVIWVRRYRIDISIPRNISAELCISDGELRIEDLPQFKKRLEEVVDSMAEALKA
jgi:hypothetical protein